MKDRLSFLNRVHIILDFILLLVAYWGTYYIKIVWLDQAQTAEIIALYVQYMYLVLPLYMLLYLLCQFYTSKRATWLTDVVKTVQANALGTLLLTLFFYLRREQDISRLFLLYFAVVNVVLLCLERVALRFCLRTMRKKGIHSWHILVVGYSKAAQAYIDRIKNHSNLDRQIHGILDDEKPQGFSYRGVEVIGNLEKLSELLDKNELEEVVVTLKLSEYAKLEEIVKICEKSGVHTKFVPDYQNIIPTRPYTEDMFGLPVVNIRYVPLNSLGNAILKRGMDLIGSVMAILLFSPVMLITALLIRLTSKGPIIYYQERVGLHNRPFRMYKFRSMVVQTEESEQGKWTTKGDSRVTKVGAFIRKTSIDELPQLFNVLKGDMSMVGPRPERPFFVEKFREEIPRYMVKHQVRPGMTGWAQVNGWRGDTSIEERIACDLYYIENWSILFDFKIMFLTVFKGFVNKNAY